MRNGTRFSAATAAASMLLIASVASVAAQSESPAPEEGYAIGVVADALRAHQEIRGVRASSSRRPSLRGAVPAPGGRRRRGRHRRHRDRSQMLRASPTDLAGGLPDRGPAAHEFRRWCRGDAGHPAVSSSKPGSREGSAVPRPSAAGWGLNDQTTGSEMMPPTAATEPHVPLWMRPCALVRHGDRLVGANFIADAVWQILYQAQTVMVVALGGVLIMSWVLIAVPLLRGRVRAQPVHSASPSGSGRLVFALDTDPIGGITVGHKRSARRHQGSR